jgi:hypothetical protein
MCPWKTNAKRGGMGIKQIFGIAVGALAKFLNIMA